ncbi:MAG: hypothetical protein WKI49_03355 [Aquificaceae bacterium]
MRYMELTPDLYTGVKEMDDQHQGIVDRINTLANLFTKLDKEMQDKKQARQALAILTGWLYGHVGRVDKRYGEFHSKLYTSA